MLIYDGDCATCTALATWVAPRLRVPISVVPWQEIGELGELGLTEAEVTREVCWVDAYGRIDRAHRAVGRALTMTSGPTVLAGWLLLVPPTSWIGAIGYRLVARSRLATPRTTRRAPRA